MKRTIKGFILGVVMSTLLMGTALAGGVVEKVTAVLKEVHISTDVMDAHQDSLVYKGTTYVPIRLVGELLGKHVRWEPDFETVIIEENAPSDLMSPKDALDYTKNIYFEDREVEFIEASKDQNMRYKVKNDNLYLSLDRYDPGRGVYYVQFYSLVKSSATSNIMHVQTLDWIEVSPIEILNKYPL